MAKTTSGIDLIEKKDILTDIKPTGKTGSYGGLKRNELLNALKLMYTSRQIDNKIMNLLKQGKAFFHIAGAGHEATQVAFGLVMKQGVDWAFPYYRDMAFMLGLGTTP